MVIAFHALNELLWTSSMNAKLASIFQFGWIGVDIFFVLSGFLITRILLDTRETPHRFRNFYARRCLRILPVYYLLLVILFVILPFIIEFDTEGVRTIQRNQGWLWTHTTNWGFVWHRKMWASADWLHLGHLWSLAVEEQFYMVWPLAVYFLNRRQVKFLCVACLVLSPVLRGTLWLMQMRNGALFFPTPCRLDGLAMGALLALLALEGGGLRALLASFRRLAIAASVLLCGLIVWRGGMRFTDSPTVVFGPILTHVIVAYVIALVVTRTGRAPDLLTVSFLRTAGKYSYGMYLFQTPLLPPLLFCFPAHKLADMMGGEMAGNLTFVAIFFSTTFATAFVSWHLFEKHWLKLKTRFEARPEGAQETSPVPALP